MKKWLKLPKVKMPKVKLPNIPLPSLKLPNLGILNYLWDMVKESIAQIFTILGFFIAWFN